MRDINEVIRRKEAELQQLQRDVEALRVAAQLLLEEGETGAAHLSRPTAGTAGRPAPSASQAGYASSWDAATKKFP
ncbi:MAG TPA: hypothetical protein VMG35_00270 [Bryobacteraceae bacterium]|nr:hypothetical protein [Bryobacteraceae bacterium]HUI54326.1 hypothetical protein [Bryobacteraceae bacterium]